MSARFPDTWEVPAFAEERFGPKNARYALIIPVINEGERIRRQLRRISEAGLPEQVDIVLADGGSTDGSLERGLLKAAGVTALLTKTGAGRLSAQLRMGYAWGLIEGYEGLITIDGNGKDSVESVPLFLEALDAGVDYAQASRFVPGGKSVNAPLLRLLAIRLLHAPLVILSALHWFTDTTQGFRGYSRRYLLDERVRPFRACFRGYELLAYLSVRATQLGYAAREIPTTRRYPAQGAVPTKISPIRGTVDLLRVLVKTCLGQYHP